MDNHTNLMDCMELAVVAVDHLDPVDYVVRRLNEGIEEILQGKEETVFDIVDHPSVVADEAMEVRVIVMVTWKGKD